MIKLKVLKSVGRGRYDFSDGLMKSMDKVNGRIQADFTTDGGEGVNAIEGMSAVILDYLGSKQLDQETLTKMSVRAWHERLKLTGKSVFDLMMNADSQEEKRG